MVAWSKAELWRGVASAPLFCLLACSSQPLTSTDGQADASGLGGKLLSVHVPSPGEALVDLATPAVLPTSAEPRPTLGWDLGFRGFEVFTNGGISSTGAGAAFGLFSPPTFLSDTAPAVPFLTPDQPGGAFRYWYTYDSENYVILSRFHVYGVRAGDRLFKVQLLSYYGGRSSESSAHYSLRYAEVGDGAFATLEARELDASVSGDAKNPNLPSICIDFATGEQLALTPAEALASQAWHLCFRRDAISVNGGQGGPRGVTALDLDARSPNEPVAELRLRTAASELARFEAIDAGDFAAVSADFRADGLVTAFTDRWLRPATDPPEPEPGVWLVVGPDGASHYLVMFEGFNGSSATGPGTVRLRVKTVL